MELYGTPKTSAPPRERELGVPGRGSTGGGYGRRPPADTREKRVKKKHTNRYIQYNNIHDEHSWWAVGGWVAGVHGRVRLCERIRETLTRQPPVSSAAALAYVRTHARTTPHADSRRPRQRQPLLLLSSPRQRRDVRRRTNLNRPTLPLAGSYYTTALSDAATAVSQVQPPVTSTLVVYTYDSCTLVSPPLLNSPVVACRPYCYTHRDTRAIPAFHFP